MVPCFEPRQSLYATFRRFLVANADIPKDVLLHELVIQTPDLPFGKVFVLDRIKYLESNSHESVLPIKKLRNRACPECAKQLYHTDLFLLHWLTHCPIHHCPLTGHCLSCKQSWPDEPQFPSKRCMACGRTSTLALFNEGIIALKPEQLAPITTLYDFIATPQEPACLTSGRAFEGCWINAPASDRHFPSYRVITHPTMSREWLNDFQISTTDQIHTRTSPLKPGALTLKDLHLLYQQAWLAQERFEAINEILQSLGKHHRKKPFVLIDYDFLSLSEQSPKDPPCPYCLALSLWFYKASTLTVSRHYHSDTKKYYFLRQLWYRQLYSPSPMVNCVVNDRTYTTSLDFQQWSYRRDLKIAFVDILTLCVFLYNKWRPVVVGAGHLEGPPRYPESAYQHYAQQRIEVDDHTMTLYYHDKNPLTGMQNLCTDVTLDTCPGYQHLFKNRPENPYRFYAPINASPLDRTTYFQIEKQLNNIMRGDYLSGRTADLLSSRNNTDRNKAE